MNDVSQSDSKLVWDWKIIALLIGIHVGALVGSLFFSWEGLVLLVILYAISGLGVTIGYHRYFTHKSFKTTQWFEKVLGISGALSGEGDVIGWVAKHNLHHKHSDTPEDPHSPSYGGFLHSHVYWMMRKSNPQLRYAGKAILENPFLKWLHQWYSVIHLLVIAALAALGFAYGWFVHPHVFAWYKWEWVSLSPAWTGAFFLASFVGYAYFLRVVLVLNATWSVNSLSHMYGSRPYQEYATDDSRNNWFVALISHGEGWHRNHHIWPKSYHHGVEWWQYDPSAWIIWLLSLPGITWDLKTFKIPSVRGELETADRD